jgi:competence protein ComEC
MHSRQSHIRPVFACALVCAVIGLAGHLAADNLTIHCLDVGQGDCTLIMSPTGGTFLFDAGENGRGNSVVIPYLQIYGLQALDYIGASHYHADHIGGIDEVVSYLGIDSVRVAVYDRGWSYTTPTYSDYAAAVAAKRTTITDGQVIDLGGGVIITCIGVNGNGQLSPPFNTQYDENDLSIALLVEYLDFKFFVAGDLSGVNGGLYNDIETSVAAEVGAVDVYRVDHHGSIANSNANLVSTLLPTVSVISVGDGNPYGHPTQTVINRLVFYGSYIYQTELGTGGTIPPGSGEVVNDDIVIDVDSTFYTVNLTDIYDMGGSGIPISQVNEDDSYGEPVMLGQPAIIRGVATVATGTFSNTHNDIFIQDATGGVNVFKRDSMVPNVSVGDSLKVSGVVDHYHGLTRITSPTINLEAVGVGEPDPVLVSTNEIATNGEAYEGLFVKVVNCSITGGTWPPEGSDGTVTVDDGSGGCTIFIDKDTNIDGSSEPTTDIDIAGVVTQDDPTFPYLSNHRLSPRSTDDILPSAGIDITTPGSAVLARILPNPARSDLRVVFSRQASGLSKHIVIYDIAGRQVFESNCDPGCTVLSWATIDSDGRSLPSGVYFATIKAGELEANTKIVILR